MAIDLPFPKSLPDFQRRISIRPASGGEWCICDDWAGVEQMIEDVQHGDRYEIRFVFLTDDEADALGDSQWLVT